MPARIGFAPRRKQMLEAELGRILEMFPQLGVEQAYLVGDMALGKVQPDSLLEVVIVQDIPGYFHRRSDFFSSHLSPMVGTSYMVYTPEEFHAQKDTNFYLRNALKTGRLVFES